MTTDLEETIKRAQRGDRNAFSQLVEGHYAAMFRFAMQYCGNREDAEDVTQQACVKLARALDQFRFQSAFSSWLYRLVINCARDNYRARGQQAVAEPADLPAPGSAESGILLGQVLALVEQMGEGFREALVLVHGEGLSHAEAAAVLEVKESTVSWRLHEIRKRLREHASPGVDV
ncbi:RNA polymerase sigma factor [Haliea sp. E17]|uniref:RNA polymerase sigma factor n=1 Tax=Haliea sp. E17 TaxID=3401576 RepID=UPI003AAF9143